ncbi:TetR/AcrR family transcriptional regulator [Humibacter albus]|uniref:TetR/AcrR family transcriptional regulator n=1 Tax=Humibacter albus TaxID=427754 RepID=UPI0003B52468|nr:TetR/AcrR family transcriptional regulator [Humibacter albus]
MDVRIARTRASLQDALLQLARERSLDEITVADIADRAGVNRSSFYQHYSDKDVLLADALDAAVEEAGAGLPALTGPVPGPPKDLFVYLDHIEQNAALYSRVLGDHGSAIVTARVRSRIERLITEAINRSNVPGYEGIPIEIVAAGITGSALGVVNAWLQRDPRPSVDVAADWLWRLLLGPGGAWTIGDAPTTFSSDAGRSAATAATGPQSPTRPL